MSDRKIYRWRRSIVTLMLAAIGISVLVVNMPAARSISAHSTNLSPAVGSSYLYRFDPISQTWFTYTLPIGALPQSVATTGTNPVHVWVAEFGLNKIGHLIFTDTSNISFIEYPVTSTVNSQPFRLVVAGNYVWFTERGANRVGRLDAATGQIDEFYGNGLSSNAGLADIKVTSNGWVWLAGEQSNRLVRLLITSTVSYAFQEYANVFLQDPFGLAIESDNSIWFTTPGGAHRFGQFTPSDGSFVWPCSFGCPANIRPMEILIDSGYAWYTDIQGNRIGTVEIGTMAISNLYGPISSPSGFARESASRYWVTQQNAPGAIARFIYTSTVSTQFDSYLLPIDRLLPVGVDVAADNGVWLTAYSPWRIYLPLIYRS